MEIKRGVSMDRAHKSQVREILVQLADLKNRLKAVYWDTGEDVSTHEEISMKKALADLNNALGNLTEVI